MQERRSSGPGRTWGRIGLCVMVVILLIGCGGQETVKTPARESEGYYQQGISFLGTDQQRAFIAFQKAVQINPHNYEAHALLGHIYFQRKEYEKAAGEFRQALDDMTEAESGDTLNYLGVTLVALNRLPEGIAMLRRAAVLPLHPMPDIVFFNLGRALTVQGDTQAAIRAYQDALKIDPPNVQRALVYLELGRLHIKQGEDNKAREALVQAKTLDPEGAAGVEASKLMKRLR